MTPAPGSESRKELEVLLASLVEVGLSAKQKTRLGELLKDNQEARLFYKRYLEVHAMLEWESGAAVAHDGGQDTLQDLLQMELAAETHLVQDLGQLRGQKPPMKINGALRWAIEHPAVWSGVAAVAAIAVVLVVIFSGEPAPTDVAVDPTTPTDRIEQQTVAKLTATHNAQWAERALARGSALHAGDRLTLTAGVAEITTDEGAVVILQAPATVELIDHNNAIHLHTGKLVGICETESSKGLLVRTPHLDITDLGTRFGVEVSDDGSTEAHVLTGEISVQPPRDAESDSEPRHLYAGQAVRAQAGADDLNTMPSRADRFAFTDEIVFDLPGTGFGVEPGQPDPNWTLAAREGQPLNEPVNTSGPNWKTGRDGLPNSADTTQTLEWHKTQRPEDSTESFLFQTTVRLPDTIDPANTRITIDCTADNYIAAIVVNGKRQPTPSQTSVWQLQTYEITQDLVAGENTIGFEVVNVWHEHPQGQPNSVGLRVAWQLQGQARPTANPSPRNRN